MATYWWSFHIFTMSRETLSWGLGGGGGEGGIDTMYYICQLSLLTLSDLCTVTPYIGRENTIQNESYVGENET